MTDLIGKTSLSAVSFTLISSYSFLMYMSFVSRNFFYVLVSYFADKYFETHLSLSQKDANELHFKYYREYGLAIEGLVRHHKVDALEYNRKVDDALPLENVIKPNPSLHKLLEDIDRSKVRLWLFTNAYITHGKRVVRLLEVEDFFEGITYCDYGAEDFVCKPHTNMFMKAMQEAGVQSPQDCYFVGKCSHNTVSCNSM
jgi:pyrimidine and pyridine-specific 5'-nucleotidase